MARITKVVPLIKPRPSITDIQDNIDLTSQRFASGSYSWYNQMMQTAHKRLQKYNDFEVMDHDVDISRALDIIADEIVGSIEYGESHQVEIDVLDESMSTRTLTLIETALKIWIETIGLESKIFHIARNLVKYGDCFFYKKHSNAKWVHMMARHVISASLDKNDPTNPIAWTVKTTSDSMYQNALSTQEFNNYTSGGGSERVAILNGSDVVRFSLCDDMSDTVPFGESVLKPVVQAFKQKELIEEAVIIYRVQRAPERRVFYIDVGKLPIPLTQQVLEQAKNEIKQKKIPRPNSSNSPDGSYDKVFDPLSTNEDYFFPVREGSRGSRVETLPGGANVGEVGDLDIFRRKMWRGLKIPYSYIEDGSDNQGAIINDGKTGVAYVQEQKFNLMVQRFQQNVNSVLDKEFKSYLKSNGIIVESSRYRIRLPKPQNFAAYRQQQLDADLLSNYSTVDGIPHIAKKFAMGRYLQLTQQDMIDNERDLRLQLGLDPDDTTIPVEMLYLEEVRNKLIEVAITRMFSDSGIEFAETEEEDEFGMGGGFDDMGGGPPLGGMGGPPLGGPMSGPPSDAGGGDLGGPPSDEGL